MSENTNQDKLIEEVKRLKLDENKLKNGIMKPDDLWEYLVAIFLHEQNYAPKRPATNKKEQKQTNLDFIFKINNIEMYAECTCANDGEAEVFSKPPNGWDNIPTQEIDIGLEKPIKIQVHNTEKIPMEETTNSMGLRLVNSLATKSKGQITKFHNENGKKITFLFVGQTLDDLPLLSDLSNSPFLSEYVQALYGLRGPYGHNQHPFWVYKKASHLQKGNGSRITRTGFLDGTFGNITAVIFSNKKPSELLNDLYTRHNGDVKELFAENTEMILNCCSDPEMDSLEGMDFSDFFPNIKKITYINNKIIQYKQGNKINRINVLF